MARRQSNKNVELTESEKELLQEMMSTLPGYETDVSFNAMDSADHIFVSS
ncbi:hypothetical protein [Bartonella bacilliformis]